jgi:hypothetical protein
MKENDYENTVKAYEEVMALLEKHKHIISPYVFCVYEWKEKLETHLFEIKLRKKYGFNAYDLKRVQYCNYYNYENHISIGKACDVMVPSHKCKSFFMQDELCMQISFWRSWVLANLPRPLRGKTLEELKFPELFNDFIEEIKAYEPKYIDEDNKNFYFSIENAGKIFNEYPYILKKYRTKASIILEEEKIEQLQKNLKDFKEENS